MFGEHMNFTPPQHPWPLSTAYSDHALANKPIEEGQCDRLTSEVPTVVLVKVLVVWGV